MARSSYIELTSEIEGLYYGALRPGDRFIAPRVNRKIDLMSLRRKKGVSQKSLLPLCASIWNTYDSTQKGLWNTAGSYCGLSGWKLFVKDKCYRVVNDIAGESTPVITYQALAGELRIDAPADELKIFQPHPFAYYISKKVTGKKGMYEPYLITEKLSLPLQIGLSYKSNLTKTQSDGFAKFYAVVRRLYQGQNLDELLEIELDLVADWKTVSDTLSFILGQYTSYALYFHLYHVRGTLLVDNIKSYHNLQNWARDPACNDIHQDFTRAFYQVPAHWSALVLPDGAFFESVYPV